MTLKRSLAKRLLRSLPLEDQGYLYDRFLPRLLRGRTRLAERSLDGRKFRIALRDFTDDERTLDEVLESYPLREFSRRFDRGCELRAIDIGGHIGAFSVALAAIFEKARIDIYELMPQNAERCRANLRLNGLEGRVRVHNKAVGATEGSVNVGPLAAQLSVGLTAGPSLFEGEHLERGAAPPTWVEILPAPRIFAPEPRVDILKLDCEASEFGILFSLSEDQLGRIDTIVGEVHDDERIRARKTNGHAWTARSLLDFLEARYATVSTYDHRETSWGEVFVFHATAAPSPAF